MATSQSSLLLLLLGVLLVISSASTTWALPGGWEAIKDVSNPQVQAAAKFAVEEIVNKTNIKYAYHKVIRGESQAVSGTNYKLQIQVRDPFRGYAIYEAVVFVKPSEHVTTLTSYTAPPGGWTAIEDVKTAEVENVAKHAIDGINNQRGKKQYEYSRVNYGESQVEAATTDYRLEVVARMGHRHRRVFHVEVSRGKLVWFKGVRHH